MTSISPATYTMPVWLRLGRIKAAVERFWAVGTWLFPLRQALRFALYSLMLLLPFSKAAVEIIFGIVLIGWLLERAHPATRRDTIWLSSQQRPLLAAIAIYLGVCALSVLVSDFPDKSLRGLISKWAEYLLYYVIMADLGSHPGVARRVVTMIAVASGVVALEGLAQEAQILMAARHGATYPHTPLGFYQRMTGPYENPIDLATYLMVAMLILMAYWNTCRAAGRWLVGALLLLLLICLGRTESLGAWLALGISLIALRVWRHASWLKAVLMIGASSLVMLTALFFISHLWAFSLIDQGMADRRVMWQAAIRMIQDRPILGHGLNTFMANYLTYWVGGEQQPRYAHNCFLQVAAETGLVGLAAFLWLLGAMVGAWWRAARVVTTSSNPSRFYLLGLSAGLIAFLVQSAVDTNFYSLRQAALFWTLAGMTTGLAWRLRQEHEVSKRTVP